MPAKVNMVIGSRFGRLVIRKEAGSGPGGVRWLCDCDCGNQIVVTGCHLRAKPSPTRSCGCLKREVIFAKGRKKAWKQNVQHGHARRAIKSKAYSAYHSMIQRCENPNYSGGKSWMNYGGRGIKICKRWRYGERGMSGFECFLADMGEPPKGYLLDRKNNDRGYSPSNCRWATRAESIANQRSHGPQSR